MESSIAVFLLRWSACELLPTYLPLPPEQYGAYVEPGKGISHRPIRDVNNTAHSYPRKTSGRCQF